MPSFVLPLILTLALCAAATAQAQSTPPVLAVPGDAADALAAAVKAQDADAIAGLYLPDAVLLSPGAAPVSGQAAIRAVWAQNFKGGMRSLTFEDIRPEQGSDRAAVAWTWTAGMAWSGQSFTGRSLVYFTLTPEGWRISADMWQPAP